MELNFSEPLTLGVDLGGTKINIGLIDAHGQVLSSYNKLINQKKTQNKVINNIITGIDECLNKTNTEAKALGIGVAAQVDKYGVIQDSPNLGWCQLDLKNELNKKLKLPILVDNDVRAATWGEHLFGAGRNVDDLVVLFVGTGIGGGVISGGNLLSGHTNTAGELGHITIIQNGRKCHCPNRGCMEAYAGGWAIAERARNALKNKPKEGKYLLSIVNDINEITATTVSKAYHEGNPLATQLVKETGQYLVAGIVSIVNAFNPQVLVLGGGVVEGIPELIQMINDIVPKRALQSAVEKLKIVKSELGKNAGVIGAATLAQKLIRKAN